LRVEFLLKTDSGYLRFLFVYYASLIKLICPRVFCKYFKIFKSNTVPISSFRRFEISFTL